MVEMKLSTSFDNPMFETRWFANLSSGLTVYEDRDRTQDPPSSWLRLLNYCRDSGEYIVQLGLRFRSEIKYIEKAKGYYLTYGAIGILGNGDTRDLNTYVVGRLQPNNQVFIEHWLTPELMIMDRDVRTYESCKNLIIAGQNEESLQFSI